MAKDYYHELVRDPLVADGWTIVSDPFRITTVPKREYVEVDLSVEKLIGARKDALEIAVEVKSFLNPSPIHDFHQAVGQYIIYRNALRLTNQSHELYLAIPLESYQFLMQGLLAPATIQSDGVNVLVFDPDHEIIVKWIT